MLPQTIQNEAYALNNIGIIQNGFLAGFVNVALKRQKRSNELIQFEARLQNSAINEAVKFITYISSNREATQIRLDAGWELPPVQDEDIIAQYKEKTPPANREAVFKSLDYLVTPPVITQYGQCWKSYMPSISRWLSDLQARIRRLL